MFKLDWHSVPNKMNKSVIILLTVIGSLSAVEWIPARGAKVAFVEVEAEHAVHTGKLIGNDRHYCNLSSEASQRRAVTLDAVGQYVEFTMPIQANSLVVRYSIPDTEEGKDTQIRDASIDVLVDGKKLMSLVFTNKYSHYYGGYPFNNKPGKDEHHFYDEIRTLLDKTYPKGTKVRLEVSSVKESPSFTIDVADFELVPPPLAKPADALSVLDYKADPTGKTDSTAAIQQAVNAGREQKKVVFIPEGTYLLYDHITVDQVHLQGAGQWHSVLTGKHPTDRKKACGVFGKQATDGGGSHNVVLKDFAILGDIRKRDDDAPTQAIGWTLSDTLVENVWIQHTKVGAWVDGPMNNFTIRSCRITDTNADGVNFHHGVTNSRVENTFLRNNGDDGLAMWAQDIPNVNNKFIQNTVGIPVLANNIAIYGGKDIEVSDNLVYDTITNGGGIHIGNRYPGVKGDQAVLGTHTVFRNTLLRTGNNDYNWRFGIGAIWFSGANEPLDKATIHIKDTDIIDSSYSAIQYIQGNVTGLIYENVFINGTGTFVLQLQSSSEATFKNVTAINVGEKIPIHSCSGPEYMKVTKEGPNSGWWTDKPFCSDSRGQWPEPTWKWYW